jgi:phosphotransacetylase/acyl dehydratase
VASRFRRRGRAGRVRSASVMNAGRRGIWCARRRAHRANASEVASHARTMSGIEPQLFVENRTFDEIEVGDRASLVRTLSRDDIELFAVMSGDVNPAHVDDEYAHSDIFHRVIAHGMWGASLISTLLGTKLPGPGTIYLEQTLHFRRPVGIGDTVTVSVTAAAKDGSRRRVALECECRNQRDEVVIDGTAQVLAPIDKVKRPRVALPEVHLHEHGVVFGGLIAAARAAGPIPTGIVHPVDRDLLVTATEAALAGVIVPVLIGPSARIRTVAADHDLDLTAFKQIDVQHSHDAAATAVAMARRGELRALAGGGRRARELIDAARHPGTGLTTDRRMSHVSVMEVPAYPRALLITDAGLNVEPDLGAKRDIVQNAIALAHKIGIAVPNVAVLSAAETVDPGVRSSREAAALAKMAERGQITGAVVDGPLGVDTAVSPAAARRNGVASPVAGQADILLVPTLESGTMLAEQLDQLGDARSAAVLVGGRVPIALPSPSAGPLGRIASCALARLAAG